MKRPRLNQREGVVGRSEESRRCLLRDGLRNAMWAVTIQSSFLLTEQDIQAILTIQLHRAVLRYSLYLMARITSRIGVLKSYSPPNLHMRCISQSAIILSASVTFMTLPGPDNSIESLIAISCTVVSVAIPFVPIFQHRLNMPLVADDPALSSQLWWGPCTVKVTCSTLEIIVILENIFF